jgi:hypothetical protein
VQSGKLNVLGVPKPGAPAGKDGALVCAGVPGTESGPEVSIMPAIPAANTNLPTIMVAERCAAWFRETALTS